MVCYRVNFIFTFTFYPEVFVSCGFYFRWCSGQLTESALAVGVSGQVAVARSFYLRKQVKWSWRKYITGNFITWSLHQIVESSFNPFKSHWLLYVPSDITLTNSTFCPQSTFVCFVWISEQTATISLYSINWLVFITERECVYCAVRTGYLYIILRSAHTVHLCVLCGSQNKQRLFPYTALTDWFL